MQSKTRHTDMEMQVVSHNKSTARVAYTSASIVLHSPLNPSLITACSVLQNSWTGLLEGQRSLLTQQRDCCSEGGMAVLFVRQPSFLDRKAHTFAGTFSSWDEQLRDVLIQGLISLSLRSPTNCSAVLLACTAPGKIHSNGYVLEDN